MLDGLFRHSADGETLTWEQYSKACVEDAALISHLGHEQLTASAPAPAAQYWGPMLSHWLVGVE